jgi:hypothetical protein
MYLGIHLGLYRALTTFHLYGPKFTSFKNGAPREDAAANAAGERAMFSVLEAPQVDMRELAVNIFGDVGIATFNGHFTRVPAKSGFDLLTCGNAARHAGDGGLLGGHGPGVDHEGS